MIDERADGAPDDPGAETPPLPAADGPVAVLPGDQGRPSAWVAGWFVALIGWTTLISFFHLDGGAEFEPTDCWVAQTAREMQEAGDWVVPRFSGETRLQKSPGAYWAVLLVSELRDLPVDRVAARVPNAVAAVVLVAVVFWLGRRIAGDRAGVYAGFAASSSVLVLYWSHRGASDLGLATLIAVSLASLWVASSCEPPGPKRTALWLLGYLAAGLAMVYKMPMPLACVGLPALLYVLLRNRWSIFASRWHLLGLLLFLLPWLPWALGVYFTEPAALAKWRVEFLDRFTGDLPNVEAQRHWKYYFAYLGPPLLFALPYTLSLPSAFARAFRRQEGVNRDGMFFLMVWFLGLFAFFTASVGKETRYILPALPPLYVLLGCELAVLFDPRRPASPTRTRLATLAVWVLTPLGLAGGGYALHLWHEHEPLFAWSEVWPPYVVAAVIFGVGASLAAWLYRRGTRNASFGALVGTMWLFWLWSWPRLMPILASEAPFIDFAAQLRDRLPVEQRQHLKHIGSQDARIIWYSDVRMPRIIDQLELLEMQGGQRSLPHEERIVAREMLGQLAGDEPVLFVSSRPDYERFRLEGPALAEEEGLPFPESFLWFETSVGRRARKHFVLFGNRPPPWPEPALNPAGGAPPPGSR